MTRTVGGQVRCTLCFCFRAAPAMFVDAEGRVWDVCQDCASEATAYAQRPTSR